MGSSHESHCQHKAENNRLKTENEDLKNKNNKYKKIADKYESLMEKMNKPKLEFQYDIKIKIETLNDLLDGWEIQYGSNGINKYMNMKNENILLIGILGLKNKQIEYFNVIIKKSEKEEKIRDEENKKIEIKYKHIKEQKYKEWCYKKNHEFILKKEIKKDQHKSSEIEPLTSHESSEVIQIPMSSENSDSFKSSNTLDESILTTILRDLSLIYTKLKFVVMPYISKDKKSYHIKQWDLWGLLLLNLILACTLAINSDDKGQMIILIFVVFWMGGVILFLNANFLGVNTSIFQIFCLLGYCLFPSAFFLFNFMLFDLSFLCSFFAPPSSEFGLLLFSSCSCFFNLNLNVLLFLSPFSSWFELLIFFCSNFFCSSSFIFSSRSFLILSRFSFSFFYFYLFCSYFFQF